MAAANEIDYALMSLLQQNIDAAREAEQDSAVEFMEKVKQAAAKWVWASVCWRWLGAAGCAVVLAGAVQTQGCAGVLPMCWAPGAGCLPSNSD